MYVPFYIMACTLYASQYTCRSKSKHYLARQESSIDLYSLRRNWNLRNQVRVITAHSFLHSNKYYVYNSLYPGNTLLQSVSQCSATMHSVRIYPFNVWYIHYWWIVTQLNATVFIYFKGNHGESVHACIFVFFFIFSLLSLDGILR